MTVDLQDDNSQTVAARSFLKSENEITRVAKKVDSETAVRPGGICGHQVLGT